MKKEELLKFYQTYRIYIFPFVVAISCLILIVLVIYPQISKFISGQHLEGQISQKSKFLEAKAYELESYNLKDLELKVNYALGAFPVDRDFTQSVGLLQKLTSQFGFSTVAITLGSSSDSKKGGLESYNLKLDLIGPSALLSGLIGSIESSPRLMKVSTLETSIQGGSNSVSVSLNVEVLYSLAPGGFGSIDSPLPQLSQKDEEVLARLARTGTPVSKDPSSASLPPRGKLNPFE